MNRAEPACVTEPTSELISNIPKDRAQPLQCDKKRTVRVISLRRNLSEFPKKIETKSLDIIIISFDWHVPFIFIPYSGYNQAFYNYFSI
jgi:hypothetical protein